MGNIHGWCDRAHELVDKVLDTALYMQDGLETAAR